MVGSTFEALQSRGALPSASHPQTYTAAEVELPPRLSVATAVSAKVPATELLQITLHGFVCAEPTQMLPAKKSTRESVPSLSEAVALRTIFVGTVQIEPLAGEVSVMVGSASTKIVLTLEVEDAARLSLARAVSR